MSLGIEFVGEEDENELKLLLERVLDCWNEYGKHRINQRNLEKLIEVLYAASTRLECKTNRYIDSQYIENLDSVGRKIPEGCFQELKEQLEADEVVVGLFTHYMGYEIAPVIVSEYKRRKFLQQWNSIIQYYAVSKDWVDEHGHG